MSDALDQQPWDVVLADYVMPRFSGLAAWELLKAKELDLPFIIVSGKIGEDIAVDAMRAGAHDYIVKGNMTRLVPAIERELREAVIRRERRQTQAERERMEAERAARAEAEAAWQQIVNVLESITDGFFALDHQWRFTFVNKEAERLLQRRRAELIGKSIWDEFPAAVDSKFYREYHRAVAEQVTAEFEELYSPLQTWFEVRAYPSPEGLSVYFRDVGERRRVEEERARLIELMQEANSHLTVASIEAKTQAEKAGRRAAELDATITSIADGVVIYDPEGKIVRMNATARQTLGYSPAEGMALPSVETPEAEPFPRDAMPAARALRGETVRGIIMVLRDASGKTTWISGSAAPINGADGGLLGAVATYSDITPLRELETQREVFVHAVSHDLRNPLQIIQGHAQILLRGQRESGHSSDAERRSLGAIVTSTKRMSAMIQDLVDAARIEGGQLRLGKQPTEMKRFVADLLERARDVVETGRIKVEIPPGLAPVCADPNRLERILLNLVSNALKYSLPDTEVLLKIEERTGKEVLVSVSDQGQGIAPEDLPHVFERFFRATGAKKAEGIRIGAVHHQDAGRGAGRPHLCQQPARRRQHLLLHPASRLMWGSS